jgi:hypothetical protein
MDRRPVVVTDVDIVELLGLWCYDDPVRIVTHMTTPIDER